jgi:hypothetical protein
LAIRGPEEKARLASHYDPIREGEKFIFNDNTSEHDLIDQGCSFRCLCGSHDCIGEVEGYKFVDKPTN